MVINTNLNKIMIYNYIFYNNTIKIYRDDASMKYYLSWSDPYTINKKPGRDIGQAFYLERI